MDANQLSSMTTRPVPNHGAERRRDIATVALNLSQNSLLFISSLPSWISW